jgi:hypothetical protein
MVFAHAEERDITRHDHLVVALVEAGLQHRDGILMQTSKDLLVHSRHAVRSLPQAFSLQVLPHRSDHFGHRPFDARCIEVGSNDRLILGCHTPLPLFDLIGGAAR